MSMKKRSGSRGNSDADSGGSASESSGLTAPSIIKSGASSAPTTPTKSSTNARKANKPKIPSDEIAKTFEIVNERPVDDISLDFFYKPHTITLLAVSVLGVMYFAFVRNEANFEENIWAGILCVVFFFLIISVLAFPNGPFTRPHPAVWRILFGCSVLYLLVLQFFMFQNHKTIMSIFHWLDPELKDFHINMDKEYGVNCSDISFERIKSHLDVFAWGHFLGWAFKAILIRHMGILWAISVMWEITEITFAHLLPNFIECWWDALILDVLICNGLGIWVGLKVVKMLEMREYKWASIKDISSTSGKIKRAVLQFTPESWISIRWLDPKSTAMRFAAVCQLVIFWQVTELNTFFLKHIFEMPPGHYVVIVRLIFIGLFVAPSVRQYYTYVTDSRCKRVGTQCWVYGAIMVSEAILCIKNGKELFERTQAINIIIWLTIQVIISIAIVYGCVLWQRTKETNGQKTPIIKDSPIKTNIDSGDAKIEFQANPNPINKEMWLLRSMKIPSMREGAITNWYRLSRNLRGTKLKIERDELAKQVDELKKYASNAGQTIISDGKQISEEEPPADGTKIVSQPSETIKCGNPINPFNIRDSITLIKSHSTPNKVSVEEKKEAVLNNLNKTINTKSLNDIKALNVQKSTTTSFAERGDFNLDLSNFCDPNDVDAVLPQQPKDYVPTFNLAAYVNKSELLQKFVELGVDLHSIERRKGLAEFVLRLDFEKDVSPHLLFLKDQGVPAEMFGEIITKNPLFFKVSIEDLQVRLDYMISKHFTPKQCERIFTINPYWLSFSTNRIDRRLGYFQSEFKLSGDLVRFVATKCPRLITYNIEHIRKATFCIREEMGFDMDEISVLIVHKPRLWMMKSDDLIERFSYAHKEMKLSHDMLLKFPEVLLSREFRLRQRHEYLKMLGRAQYDPSKDMYISPKELVEGTDRIFATKVAKSDIKTYEMFLKTR